MGIELPRAIGELDLTIMYRACHGKYGQRRTHADTVDKLIHRIVKIIELLCIEFFKIRYHNSLIISCAGNCKTCICAANITYQKHLPLLKRHQ